MSMSNTLEIDGARNDQLAGAGTHLGALRWFPLLLGVFTINLVVVALACLVLNVVN
jgi:hypothetical protein